MGEQELATKRIPVTPTVFENVREFCRGLDMNYSDGLKLLLSFALKEGEDAHMAGRRLREEARKEAE